MASASDRLAEARAERRGLLRRLERARGDRQASALRDGGPGRMQPARSPPQVQPLEPAGSPRRRWYTSPMRVAELWRYPVKSLQGERLDSVRITRDGLEGDRRFAIYDLETGFGLTARRSPELLFASARFDGEHGTIEITLPDGSRARGDDDLSEWLGRPVALRSVEEEEAARRYENPVDFEREATGRWKAFRGASGPFHDASGARVTLVSTTTLGDWDRRRFRSNVLLDGEGEEALVGSRAVLGDALVKVGMHISRCVMVTRPQPGGIDRDLDVLRTIAREREARLAVGATVVSPGVVGVGARLGPA